MELKIDVVSKISEYSLFEFCFRNIWIGVKVSLNGLTVPSQNHDTTNGEERVGKVKDLGHGVEPVKFPGDQVGNDVLDEEGEVHDRQDRNHGKCFVKEDGVFFD